MNIEDRIAVCSRSFSKHPLLRAELSARYKYITFNDTGEQLQGERLVSFLEGHTKAITALEHITESVVSRLPQLKLISKYGVGLDMIDLVALQNFGITLRWMGGVNRRSVAELTLAFAISLMRHVLRANRNILIGEWRQLMGSQLSGKIVGIIGCGHVGKDLVTLLQPFGCRILVNDVRQYSDFYNKYNIEAVNLSDLLARSDVITLHVPFDSTTKNILSAEMLEKIKQGSVLINTARGGLVDEVALKSLLKRGIIGAAAFDVFKCEPPEDTELLNLSNFLATPHIGGSAQEAVVAMGFSAIEGLDNVNLTYKV